MSALRHALAGFAAALACGAATWAVTPATPPAAANDQARIEQRYQQAVGRCAKVQGHGRELCQIQARGERQVQSAQLAQQGKRTPETERKLQLARAEATHAEALVKCQVILGAARTVCRQDANAALDKARALAGLPPQPVDGLRPEGVGDGQPQADRIAQAQLDAARERCDWLPDEARQACLGQAQRSLGRY
jgi:hypothetical protein